MSISATKTAAIKFGDFTAVCQRAALIVCPLLETENGIEPNCYSRNVQLGSQLIFQPGKCEVYSAIQIILTYNLLIASCVVHIAAILMTLIMVYHVRSKYTAVGRKEIVLFFYIYMVIELLAIFLDSGIIPTANSVYPVSHEESNIPDQDLLLRFCCFLLFVVVHCGLCRINRGSLLVLGYQRFRRLPVRRRWNTHVALGKLSI
jgi:hypothetical protein